MIALVRTLISLLVTAIAIFFALGNREAVHLRWSPFQDAISVPLFAVVLGGACIGLLAGALLMWLQSMRGKLALHRERQKVRTLESEVHDLKMAQNLHNGPPSIPVIRPRLDFD